MTPVRSVPLWARDTIDDIKSAPQTFSSWDKCMQKSYCKWPVIVGIIVGSIIIITIIACVINCLCCGYQCCKCCCCDCCSCCCPSPRRRPDRSKFLDNTPYQPPPPPPFSNNAFPPARPSANNAYNSPAPPAYRGAQVARFDTPSSTGAAKVDEDALPAMPSWDNAITKHVEDDTPREDMEMEPLNPAHTHRSPSPGRPSPVPTPALPGYRGFDNESSYTPRSPTLPSPGPMSPYDHHQPYRDHAFANPYQSRTGTPAAYTPQPQHYNPSAPRPAASPVDMPRYSPYGQPSPGFPFRQPSPGIMPVRQPSPGVMPVRQHSPGIVPYRQPSPGSVNPPPSFATNPPYRGMSPSIPTSPPPPFVSAPASETNEPGRPPSLLQSGRRPVPNSYRDV